MLAQNRFLMRFSQITMKELELADQNFPERICCLKWSTSTCRRVAMTMAIPWYLIRYSVMVVGAKFEMRPQRVLFQVRI